MVSNLLDYCRWIARWRRKPVLAWVTATELYNHGRYREAIPHYVQGLERHAFHPAARAIRLDLAYCLFRDAKVVAAIEQLQIAQQAEPGCAETLLKLAHLQAWIGLDAEVVQSLVEGLCHVSPTKELYALLLLSSQRLRGSNSFAEKMLARAAELKDDDDVRGSHLLMVAEGKYQILKGETRLGRKVLLEACSSDATSPEALIVLAEFLLSHGKVAFARQQLRRALSLVPQQPIILALLAETYLVEAAGYNPQYALQLALQAAQASCWSSPDALYSLAKAYLANNDSESAVLVLELARDKVNSNIGLYRVGAAIEQLHSQLLSSEASVVT